MNQSGDTSIAQSPGRVLFQNADSPKNNKENFSKENASPSKNWCIGPWVDTKQQLNHIYDKKILSPFNELNEERRVSRKPLLKIRQDPTCLSKCSTVREESKQLIPTNIISFGDHLPNLSIKCDKPMKCKSFSVRGSVAKYINAEKISETKYIIHNLFFPKIAASQSIKIWIPRKLKKYTGRELVITSGNKII